jgi:hypothetical protein
VVRVVAGQCLEHCEAYFLGDVVRGQVRRFLAFKLSAAVADDHRLDDLQDRLNRCGISLSSFRYQRFEICSG